MDRETLVADLEAKNISFEEAKANIIKTIQTTIEEVLAEAGVSSIATVQVHRDETAKIIVPRHDKQYGLDMDLYFYRDYDSKTHGYSRRKAQLNAGTFGSIDASDVDKINFYIVAGEVAKNLGKLQAKFDAIDFKPFYAAEDAYYRAKSALEKFDADERAVKHEEEKNKILSKLIVGAKLEKGLHPYDQTPVYDTVERVTNKLVFLKNMYGTSMKKDKFVELFKSRNWKFVD